MSASRPAGRAALAVAVVFGLAVLWWSRLRFWYPHDEGTLAQAAWRVLQGQVPHRDFAHPYTGGDALLHAAFLRLFDPSLAAIRNGFALVTSAWLVGLALWFRSHLGSVAAAAVVVVLGVWSVPMYPGALPSWYVTMLVTAAIAILAPPVATELSSRRVVLAGAALGMALAFKVTAVYAIVGAVAWLAVRSAPHQRFARPWVVGLMLLAALATVRLLAPTLSPRTAVHLLLPPLLVGGYAILLEWRRWREAGWRWKFATLREPTLLGLGVAIGAGPVVLWLAVEGGLSPLVTSLGEVGRLRASFAAMPAAPVEALLAAVPLLALIGMAWLPRPPRPWIVALPCLAVFLLAWNSFEWHRAVWLALRGTLPIGVALSLWMAWRDRSPIPPPWLGVVAVAAWMTLSQFPFAAAIYFVYLVPILLMAAVGAAGLAAPGRRVLAVVVGALVAFGVGQVVPSPPTALGFTREPAGHLARLPGPHGGLLVPPEDSIAYDRLLALLADSVPPGPIWSGPDSPEVAFLAGRRDLNPAFFGFLGDATDEHQMAAAVALVIPTAPAFSSPPDSATLARWQARFSRRADLGSFLVFWGERSCADC